MTASAINWNLVRSTLDAAISRPSDALSEGDADYAERALFWACQQLDASRRAVIVDRVQLVLSRFGE